MLPNYKRRTLIKRIIFAGSIIGFTATVIQVSILYFSYRTTTQVKLTSPPIIRMHAVVLCIRYIDIIDAEKMKNETGLTFRPLKSLDDGIDQEDMLTVEQIFKYTPHENDFFSSCFSRPDNWRYNIANDSSCYDGFNVTRFMTLEYMCYRVAEKLNRNLTLLAVTRASFLQYRIYELTLSQRFRAVSSIIPIVFGGGYPYLSRDYTSALPQLRIPDSDQLLYNIFEVYPSDVSSVLLPPPFDTRCIHEDEGKPFTCRKECLIREYAMFDRAPAFELLTEPLKLKVFTVKDLRNTSLLQMASKAYYKCVKTCSFVSCHQGYSKTTSRVMKDSNTDLRYSLLTSVDSEMIIIAQATMTFIEYFSFVSGCFGTWFGLSFLSLDPLRILRHQKAKRLNPMLIRKSKLVSNHEPWRQMQRQ